MDEELKKHFEERRKEMKGEKKSKEEQVKEISEEHPFPEISEKMNIGHVWETLDKLIVGEDSNKMVLFLNALSCFLKQPNGTIITSDASAGKTHLVREVLKLFPEDKKIVLGGASKKALIHMKGDKIINTPRGLTKYIDFSGKILWFLEDKGGEESYDILRPILSRDQEEIIFELPTKKKSKKGSEFFTNDIIVIKGCPAYITTTTKQERLPEMGTRVFLLSMDESKEQTKKVMEYKANRRRFLIEDPVNLIEEIKKYISKLKSYDVWIPFADLVQISAENLNVRRDIDKIFALIEAYTLFHQFERPKVEIRGKTYLVPKLTDLFDVLDIAVPILNPTLMNLPKKILTFYDKLKELDKKGAFDEEVEVRDRQGNIIDSKIEKKITHRKIAELTEYNQDTVRKYCWELVKAGKLSSWKEKNMNHYAILDKNDDKSVAIVTKSEVTSDLIKRSLESVKSYISGTVTEKEIQYNIYKVLDNIYNISVTLYNDSNLKTSEPETSKFDVTKQKVTKITPKNTDDKKIKKKEV